MKIYALYDKATQLYATPWYQEHEIAAIRLFKTEVNRQKDGNMLYSSPQDFSLALLGEYDDKTGTFTTHTPVTLLEASKVKET